MLEPIERIWFSEEVLADPDQAARARLILVACLLSGLPCLLLIFVGLFARPETTSTHLIIADSLGLSPDTGPSLTPAVSDFALDGVHALIADDDPRGANILAEHLRSLGAEVECVIDGQAAIDRCVGAPPQLILMDLEMPHVDGMTACRQNRDLALPNTRPAIVAVTGRIDVNAAQLKEFGFDALLLKPIRREDLLRCLRELGF